MDLLGVLAGGFGQADDGVLIDAHQAGRLADATAFLEVTEDIESLVVGQAGAEQGGALALGEAVLAGATGEHAQAVFAVVEADAEVALTAQAVIGAVGVLATEQFKLSLSIRRSRAKRRSWS